jgi:hypothetical protein
VHLIGHDIFEQTELTTVQIKTTDGNLVQPEHWIIAGHIAAN